MLPKALIAQVRTFLLMRHCVCSLWLHSWTSITCSGYIEVISWPHIAWFNWYHSEDMTIYCYGTLVAPVSSLKYIQTRYNFTLAVPLVQKVFINYVNWWWTVGGTVNQGTLFCFTALGVYVKRVRQNCLIALMNEFIYNHAIATGQLHYPTKNVIIWIDQWHKKQIARVKGKLCPEKHGLISFCSRGKIVPRRASVHSKI